jgi:hypothetical protein
MVAQQKKYVLMLLLILMENSAQSILSPLLMAAQCFVMTSKEKSCAHQWKTLMVVRNHPFVCKEQQLPMDNTAQLILSAQPTVVLMRLLAHMKSILEVAKKLLFAELKDQIRTENYVLEFAHQLAQLMRF